MPFNSEDISFHNIVDRCKKKFPELNNSSGNFILVNEEEHSTKKYITNHDQFLEFTNSLKVQSKSGIKLQLIEQSSKEDLFSTIETGLQQQNVEHIKNPKFLLQIFKCLQEEGSIDIRRINKLDLEHASMNSKEELQVLTNKESIDYLQQMEQIVSDLLKVKIIQQRDSSTLIKASLSSRVNDSTELRGRLSMDPSCNRSRLLEPKTISLSRAIEQNRYPSSQTSSFIHNRSSSRGLGFNQRSLYNIDSDTPGDDATLNKQQPVRQSLTAIPSRTLLETPQLNQKVINNETQAATRYSEQKIVTQSTQQRQAIASANMTSQSARQRLTSDYSFDPFEVINERAEESIDISRIVDEDQNYEFNQQSH